MNQLFRHECMQLHLTLLMFEDSPCALAALLPMAEATALHTACRQNESLEVQTQVTQQPECTEYWGQIVDHTQCHDAL
jgi:hypothetical protein